MRHLEVLVVTRARTTSRILNWKVSTVNTIETAIEKLQQRPFKVVAVSNTIAKMDKIKLNQIASVLFNDLVLVEFREDDNTLPEIVKAAYWSKQRPAIERNYLDNSFEIKLANSIKLN